MNEYTSTERDTLVGTLMLGFVGISAFVGLIPLGYVLVWFFGRCL